jgi:cysteine desulfurase
MKGIKRIRLWQDIGGNSKLAEIYFDNSSTTRVCREAAEKVMEVMTEEYGNPSSLHTKGFRAEQEMSAARESVAQALGAEPGEITFTSGGTESNNIALFGAARARRKRGRRIVTTAIEHPSVLNTVARLEQEGFEVIRLQPDCAGKIAPEQFREAVTPDTILVSVMRVNNEVGSIQPVEAAADAIEAAKAPALLHVDAVQAFGKLRLRPRRMRADLMSVSGHKIHAPKGVGALYIRSGVHIEPLTYGGGQERDMRPGTESVPLIAGLGAAVRALPEPEAELARMRELNGFLRRELSKIPGVCFNSPDDALPYILNLSAGGVRAETMLHFLSEKGIYVSSGSACSKGRESYVLRAMGLPKDRIGSALRLSFSRFNTKEEAETFVRALKNGLASLVKRPF